MATVSDIALNTFNEWKIRDQGKYLIFGLKAGEIVVDKIGDKNSTWEQFLEELQEDKPCWATYHLDYTCSAGKRNKTTFIQWIPSRATAKDKMQYAMWSNNIKTALNFSKIAEEGGGSCPP